MSNAFALRLPTRSRATASASPRTRPALRRQRSGGRRARRPGVVHAFVVLAVCPIGTSTSTSELRGPRAVPGGASAHPSRCRTRRSVSRLSQPLSLLAHPCPSSALGLAVGSRRNSARRSRVALIALWPPWRCPRPACRCAIATGRQVALGRASTRAGCRTAGAARAHEHSGSHLARLEYRRLSSPVASCPWRSPLAHSSLLTPRLSTRSAACSVGLGSVGP